MTAPKLKIPPDMIEGDESILIWTASRAADRGARGSGRLPLVSSGHAGYSITVAAAETALTPRALRYYEEVGLIEPFRTRGGDRRYSHALVVRLRRIALMRKAGASVRDIRQACALPEVAQDRRAVEMVHARIEALAQERRGLKQALAAFETRRD